MPIHCYYSGLMSSLTIVDLYSGIRQVHQLTICVTTFNALAITMKCHPRVCTNLSQIVHINAAINQRVIELQLS